MRKTMKYEGQSSYVRAVCKKEVNGATYNLFRFTKKLHKGMEVIDVKVTHDVKDETKNDTVTFGMEIFILQQPLAHRSVL